MNLFLFGGKETSNPSCQCHHEAARTGTDLLRTERAAHTDLFYSFNVKERENRNHQGRWGGPGKGRKVGEGGVGLRRGFGGRGTGAGPGPAARGAASTEG